MRRYASERWLREGSTDDQYADAMMRCRIASGECSYQERCLDGGSCFRQPKADDVSVLQRKLAALEARVEAMTGSEGP